MKFSTLLAKLNLSIRVRRKYNPHFGFTGGTNALAIRYNKWNCSVASIILFLFETRTKIAAHDAVTLVFEFFGTIDAFPSVLWKVDDLYKVHKCTCLRVLDRPVESKKKCGIKMSISVFQKAKSSTSVYNAWEDLLSAFRRSRHQGQATIECRRYDSNSRRLSMLDAHYLWIHIFCTFQCLRKIAIRRR